MTQPVVVARTGTANTASVVAALERGGCRVEVTTDAAAFAAADRAVLPGVGAFGPVVRHLQQLQLMDAVRERFISLRPLLAICLGLQVLAEGSDESPGEAGLGVLPVTVRRFPDGVVVPQLGWNRVEAGANCRLLSSGAAYFANSYRIDTLPAGFSGAFSDHGGPFVAAVERGPVLACQFHPELSGQWGQELIERWLSS
jgi:imidazole glycerol phosphate synthase glutamine amidotransferase subunit